MSSVANIGRIVPLHKGPFNAAVQYVPLDEVLYNGSSYRVKFGVLPPVAALPTNASYWIKVATAGPGISGVGALSNGDDVYAVDLTFTLQDGTTYTVTTPNLRGATGPSETAASVLAKLLTVDGLGSGLDADTVRGLSPDFFQNASNINFGTIGDDYLTARISTIGEPISDANLAIENGWYYSTGTLSNFPAAGFFSIFVESYGGARIRQYCTSHAVVVGSATTRWVRRSTDGGTSWEAWVTVQETVTEQDARYAQLATANVFTNSLSAASIAGTWVALQADAEAGTSVTKVMTPLRVAQAITYNYTASNVLSKLLTVDGAGSGLDADVLDGQEGSFYQNSSNQNAGTLPDARLSGRLGVTSSFTTNLNTIDENGWYRHDATCLNTPVTDSYGMVFMMRYDGNWAVQYWKNLGSPTYTRLRAGGGVWGAWELTLDTQSKQDARYLQITDFTAAATLTKLLTVDGAGSGLDADLLDGINSSGFVQTSRTVTAGTGLTGGGALSANITLTVSFSTQGEAETGTLTTKAMNALGVKQAIDYNFTGANALAKLLTVDGAASGLDADLLDGQHGAYYLALSAYTGASIISRLLTVDGTGSGLDADLLDGQESSFYQNSSNQNAGTLPDARLTSRLGTLGMAVTDLDPIRETGFYTAVLSAANIPITVAGTVFHQQYVNSLYAYQYWSAVQSNRTFTRYLNNGTWSPWVESITAQTAQDARYLQITDFTAAATLTKLLTVDGAGSGLDADLLDGYNASLTTVGNTVVVRDGSGNINGNYIAGSYMNMSHGQTNRPSDTVFYSSQDAYIRKNDANGMRKSLSLNTDWIMGYFPNDLSQYGTERIIAYMPYAGTITSLTHRVGAGAITVAVRINGVNVTSLNAVAVNTTTSITAATAANTFAVGAYIELVISANIATDTDFSFQIEVERT